MIRSPAGPGTTGQPWSRRPELATCARLRIKGTFAAAVEHAGIKMSKKYNIEFTNEKKYYNAGLAGRLLL